MSSNKDCEYGIDCNKCKSRGMCTSYANHMYSMGLMKGRADRDREIAESNVFFSNRPIEDIVLEARADERERIIKLLDNLKPHAKNKDVEYAIEYIQVMLRGGEND